MPLMDAYRKVREALGIEPAEMGRKVDREDVREYLYLERKAQRVSLADVYRLFLASGWSQSKFYRFLHEEAKEDYESEKLIK